MFEIGSTACADAGHDCKAFYTFVRQGGQWLLNKPWTRLLSMFGGISSLNRDLSLALPINHSAL